MIRPLSILQMIDKNRLDTGSVVQLFESAAGLAERGHRVAVCSRPGGDLEHRCTGAGINFIGLPLRHPFDLGSALRLRSWLRRTDPDLVHVHKGRAHAVTLVAATGVGGRPALVVNRGVSFPLDLFNRSKYKHPRVAAVVCVADAVREVVMQTAGVAAHKVHTIHSATDVQRFDPELVDRSRLRTELGLSSDNLLLGQVSVREWKGWHDLLAATAMLIQDHPALRLLLVGCEPGDQTREVVGAARELGLGEQLITLPFRTDMPEVLAACDVVVDASRQGSGITGTIREAMALARAVVASDCAGNPELVEHEQNGLLVPAGGVEELAAAIGRLLGDQEQRTRLGSAARRRVVAHFSLETKLDRLEALYRRIVEGRDDHPMKPRGTGSRSPQALG